MLGIAATSRNLEEMLEKGLFRDDLYYRLNVVPLFVPPLRQRKEDIPILVESFIKKVSENMGKPVKGITRQAVEKPVPITGRECKGNCPT